MIARQKIRTIQLLLLVVGGALIFYGVLRHQNIASLKSGYSELWDDQLDSAQEYFLEDLDEHPDRVESRLGLIITMMRMGRGDEASAIWAFLNEPSQPKPDAADVSPEQMERWRNYTRIVEWQGKSPRIAQQYRGERLMAESWVRGYQLVRSHRRGDDSSDRSRYEMAYRDAMQRFNEFIQRKKADEANNPFADGVVAWEDRLRQIEDEIAKAPKIDDLILARQVLGLPTKPGAERRYEVAGASTEMLKRALTSVLHRAAEETPDKLPIRSLHYLVLAELTRLNNQKLEQLDATALMLLRAALKQGPSAAGSYNEAELAEFNLALCIARVASARYFEGAEREAETQLAMDALDTGVPLLEPFEQDRPDLVALRDSALSSLKALRSQ